MKRVLIAAAVMLCAAGAVWAERRMSFFWAQGKEFLWKDFPPVSEREAKNYEEFGKQYGLPDPYAMMKDKIANDKAVYGDAVHVSAYGVSGAGYFRTAEDASRAFDIVVLSLDDYQQSQIRAIGTTGKGNVAIVRSIIDAYKQSINDGSLYQSKEEQKIMREALEHGWVKVGILIGGKEMLFVGYHAAGNDAEIYE